MTARLRSRRLAVPRRMAGKLLPAVARLSARIDWLAVIIAVVVSAAYLRTLAPSVLWSDYGEYQYSAYGPMVPHQTGYPLFILLAKLWTFLPVGDIAYRVNLMSAFWGVVTILLTYECVKRLTGQKAIAAVSALTLAFSAAFWFYASISAVRTFHTLFVALVTLLVINLAQRRTPVEAIALALGLSLTHHRMTIFLFPGVAWAVWRSRSHVRWSLRRWIVLALLFVLPQALYLFVVFGRQWGSAREFWNFVLALNEGPAVLSKPLEQILAQFAQQVLPALWKSLTPVGLGLALVGFVALGLDDLRGANRRGVGGYLIVGWVLNIFFAGIHFTEDPTHYLTHGFVLQAVAMGAGLATLLDGLGRVALALAPALSRFAKGKAAWLTLVLPLVMAWVNLPIADQSGTGWIGPFTLEELTSIEANSTVIADWSFTMPYRYHQIVEGQRRDITLIMDNDQAAMDRADAKIKSGGAVYLRQRRVGNRWRVDAAAPGMGNPAARQARLFGQPPPGECRSADMASPVRSTARLDRHLEHHGLAARPGAAARRLSLADHRGRFQHGHEPGLDRLAFVSHRPARSASSTEQHRGGRASQPTA